MPKRGGKFACELSIIFIFLGLLPMPALDPASAFFSKSMAQKRLSFPAMQMAVVAFWLCCTQHSKAHLVSQLLALNVDLIRGRGSCSRVWEAAYL